jgi:hypothetical protein
LQLLLSFQLQHQIRLAHDSCFNFALEFYQLSIFDNRLLSLEFSSLAG